jgi:hypothetical protein
MRATEMADVQEEPRCESAIAGSNKSRTLLWAALLVALRLPFVATHNVQEDAYISLRCARNLALGLGYGFNAGERVNASTAHAFVLSAALVYRVFGEAFVPVWQFIGACCVVGGIYCIASAVSSNNRERELLWILGSVTPIALLISFLGLETPLLILVVGLLILDLKRPLPRLLSLLLIGLLPWIRADAVAIGLILLACQWLRDRRPNFRGASALIAGASTVLMFNRLYFGQWLNQSIVAKQTLRQINPWAGTFAQSLREVFLGLGSEGIRNVFAPLRTKYLLPIEPLFTLVGVAVCVWAARAAWRNSQLRAPLAALLAVGLLMPLPYAWSGWLFPWYFHPSMLCLALLAVLFLLRARLRARQSLRPYILPTAAALLACLAAGQWALSLSHGAQDYYFIGGVGRYLRSIAIKEDTLLLEPAGYIPFYSRLYTWDEVGIVSPEISRFQKRFGPRWWPQFVEAKRPTFLVERRETFSPLSSEERAWFDRNYQLIRKVSYDPEAIYRNPFLRRIARTGSALELLVYRRIPESGSSER